MKTFWKDGRPSASFVVGAVALLFLIIGYQSALFIRKASVARIVANHDHPDTVYVYYDSVTSERSDRGSLRGTPLSPPRGRRGVEERSREEKSSRLSSDGRPSEKVRKNGHSTDLKYRQAADEIRWANTPRRYENFRFDPNTASIDDLMRLGFSQKQAQSIDNYRKKGGRFRRKADFAKSFVVADSVFRRLEEYIDIPKIDINKADSAVFETLPGIGKYFASKMVSYREELGGYSYPEQLMDIRHFDKEKFDGLKDLITVGSSVSYPLWNLTEEELTRHPYIGKAAAHGIVLFRNNSPVADWAVENLVRNGILDNEKGEKLARCRISPPDK
jgi:DNA uptake protein ComE-like DNA-binding protein